MLIILVIFGVVIGIVLLIIGNLWIKAAGLFFAVMTVLAYNGVLGTNEKSNIELQKQFIIENKEQFLQFAEQKRDSLLKLNELDELKKFDKLYYSILEDLE